MDDEGELTIGDALASVQQAVGFTEPLRRRTEGVTIAWWGLVTVAIVLTSGVLDDLHGFMHAGGWKQIISMTAWVPWAALGLAGTVAIWRVAETGIRDAPAGRRTSAKALAGWIVAFVLILLALVFWVPIAQAGTAVVVIGLIWLAIGGLDLYRATSMGRRSILIIGGLVALVGVVFGVLTAADNPLGWQWFTFVAVLSGGLVPIGVGLAQALRG